MCYKLSVTIGVLLVFMRYSVVLVLLIDAIASKMLDYFVLGLRHFMPCYTGTRTLDKMLRRTRDDQEEAQESEGRPR